MKGIDPVDDRLVIDGEQAGDAAEAIAFDVKRQGLLAHLICIDWRVGCRGINALTSFAFKALTAGAVKPALDLIVCSWAMGTLAHYLFIHQLKVTVQSSKK